MTNHKPLTMVMSESESKQKVAKYVVYRKHRKSTISVRIGDVVIHLEK